MIGATPVDSLFVPTQGPPGGAGLSSQPAPHGVWEGECPGFFPLCCVTLMFTWILWSSKILPGVRIIIANPETKGPMGESHLGEVRIVLTPRDVKIDAQETGS